MGLRFGVKIQGSRALAPKRTKNFSARSSTTREYSSLYSLNHIPKSKGNSGSSTANGVGRIQGSLSTKAKVSFVKYQLK
jgi:hypothetical protein